MSKTIRCGPWLLSLLLCMVFGTAQAKGFLWKVEGGSAPLYLVGTLHALPDKVRPLPYKFDRAYAEAQVLVFSTDISATDDPAQQQALVQAGLYPNGETMHEHWPKDLISDFKDAAHELDAPLGQFVGAQPWLAGLGLEMFMYDHAGFSSKNSVAHILYQRALNDGKSIITLETPATQLALYTDMPDAMSQRYLRATIAELDELDYSAQDVLDLWNDADTGDLEDVQSAISDDYPDIYSRFVTQRNRRWIATILDLLRQNKPGMVVVDALHMPGDNGLIAYLRKGGYKVKQIDSD